VQEGPTSGYFGSAILGQRRFSNSLTNIAPGSRLPMAIRVDPPDTAASITVSFANGQVASVEYSSGKVNED
jgi:hypothetical protein